MFTIEEGDVVEVRKGICGEGYQFTVTTIAVAYKGYEAQVYGYNYGPMRLSEVKLIAKATK